MVSTVWLLDTCLLVDVLRGHQPARNWIDAQPQSVCAISVVTGAELLAGCRTLREQRIVEREINAYPVLWLNENIARTAFGFYRRWHLSHHLGFFDCLIAATAYLNHLKLATLNVKHFSSVRGLQVVRPY
jgi:predicted nucleic acid-binding protein